MGIQGGYHPPMHTLLLALCPLVATPAADIEVTAAMLEACRVEVPAELFAVTRVVDGDTIWIEREGEREKLRLLSVDTEEKMTTGNSSASKPGTAYGERVAGWTQGYFSPRVGDEGPVRVGLRFPPGGEARDVYGRLLCHVVTAEGVDFNLLLVRSGMSPYFNKYGSSRIDHERFVEAQASAKRDGVGIWEDDQRRAGATRPYAQLIPWWDARAEAVDRFRQVAKEKPLFALEADDPDALQAALDGGSEWVMILGLIDRIFEEDDGSRTLLLRGGDKKRSLRVKVPAEQVHELAAVDLEGAQAEYRQNYLHFAGALRWGSRGFDLVHVIPSKIRRAGPEPVR